MEVGAETADGAIYRDAAGGVDGRREETVLLPFWRRSVVFVVLGVGAECFVFAVLLCACT